LRGEVKDCEHIAARSVRMFEEQKDYAKEQNKKQEEEKDEQSRCSRTGNQYESEGH